MSPIPPDATWQEWNDLCFRAARVMGISLEAIGEKRVTDVLQALHAHREGPVIVDSGDEEVGYEVTFVIPFNPTMRWPEELDLDGRTDEKRNVEYIGKATHLHDEFYKVLARVENTLCIVEVRVTLIGI